jgi:hypothetical protein
VAIFRTMQDRVWDELLPKEWQNWITPCGLNVSSPIQGIANFAGFGIDTLRYSGDSETEAYYKSVKANYKAVKAKGQAAQAKNKRAKALKVAQEGGEVKLSWKKGSGNPDRWTIRLGALEADLSFPAEKASDYGLVKDQLLSVEYSVVEGEHPHRFAVNSTVNDDCWGLGIRVSGKANKAHGIVSAGGKFEIWLKMKCIGTGRKTVKMANSIVDFVSGMPPDTTHTTSERYYRHRSVANGKKMITYT